MCKQNDDEKMIRVAQIMGKLWAGGVESVVFNYYREMDHSKIQFDFYYDADSTIEPPEDLIDMGAVFYKIPPYQNLFSYLKTLFKCFKGNHYIIVHSHMNTLSVFPLFVAWIAGVPVRIAHNHSVPGGREYHKNILKYFLRTFSKLFPTDYFACSEKAGRWMFGDRAFNQGDVRIVKNAIDWGKFSGNAFDSKFGDELNIENKFVVGHVGRFTYAKNHLFLIDIFIEILKHKKDAVLLLVGDGETRNSILNKIWENGIEDKVILVGKTSMPERYYSLMDVIILPSLFEGLSLTTIEAQISKKPIVISEVVPQETNISINGFAYMNLNDSPGQWAKKAIELASHQVELLPSSKEYDIRMAAPLLCDWYIRKAKMQIWGEVIVEKQ